MEKIPKSDLTWPLPVLASYKYKEKGIKA